MNKYFDLLIDSISEHGGDVIKFAGDALQVVWRNRPADGSSSAAAASSAAAPATPVSAVSTAKPNGQDSLAGLVLRAANCCLDLLLNLNEYSPVEG
jgi:class 3 adenylate cyclase